MFTARHEGAPASSAGSRAGAGLRVAGPRRPPTRLSARRGLPQGPAPASGPAPQQLPGLPPGPRLQAGTRILSPRDPNPLRRGARAGTAIPAWMGSSRSARSAPIAPDLPAPPTGRSTLTPEEQHQEEVGQPRAELEPPPPPPQRHVERSRGVASVQRSQAFPARARMRPARRTLLPAPSYHGDHRAGRAVTMVTEKAEVWLLWMQGCPGPGPAGSVSMNWVGGSTGKEGCSGMSWGEFP